MNFELSGDQKALRDEIRRFARERLSPGAAERDAAERFDRDLWTAAAAQGILGLPHDEAVGGAGADSLTTALALEALGEGCDDGGLVFSLGAHLLAVSLPLAKFGDDAQAARWLRGMIDGTTIAANAMTEPEAGSDAFSMRTRAVADGDDWILDGTKTYVTNAPVADLFLLFAITDPDKGFHGGVTAFLAPRGTDGLSVGPAMAKMGLRSSPIADVVMEEVRLGPDAVLGGVGGGAAVFTEAMNHERVGLFASHVGTMDRLLAQTIEHARERQQSGRPIGVHQGVSHRIADLKARVEASRWLVRRAAWALDRSRTAGLDASIAKLFTAESFVDVAKDALHLFGGHGYMVDGGVERIVRDAMAATIYSGTSEVQRNLIARWIGLPAG